MTRANPTVTTIVPLYNRAAMLADTLDSLLTQTFTDWEAVIVDDGSTDDGPEIATAYARRDPRFRVVRRPNGGVSAARNTGLDHARGEYIHFLDADDIIEPEAFTLLVRAERQAGLGAAAGSHVVVGLDDVELHWQTMVSPVIGLDELIDGANFCTGQFIISRERLGSIRFDETLPRVEDRDFLFRCCEAGIRWACFPTVVFRYRMRPASLVKSGELMMHCCERVMLNLYDRLDRCPADRRAAQLTVERLDAVLGYTALAYATRMVVVDGLAGVDDAVRAYAAARGTKYVTPGQAAGFARSAVIRGLCVWPSKDDPRRAHWEPAVEALWQRLEDEGWGEPGLARIARAMLWCWSIRPEHIADELLDRCAGRDAVTLVGFGQNGRLLAQRAACRGMRVFVRDDRFPEGRLSELENFPGITAEAMSAPIPAGRAVLITPLNDDALLARFAKGPGVYRWAEAMNDVAQRHEDLPAPGPRLVAA